MDRKNNGKVALVTGASTGIGAELAKRFAEGGFDLVLVARSRDKLERLAEEVRERFGISVRIVVKDLSDPAACDELIRELEEAGAEVHALVNNAGIGVYGPFIETDWVAEGGITAIQASSEVTDLLPPDAELVQRYYLPATPDGPVGLVVERYESVILANRLAGQPLLWDGSLIVVYQQAIPDESTDSEAEPLVTRVSISAGTDVIGQ